MLELEKLLLDTGFLLVNPETDLSFELIEKQLSHRLPNDYKFYLENFKPFEGFIGPEYVALWGYDFVLESNAEIGIFSLVPNTLLVGSNGGGEYIAFYFSEQEQPSVVITPAIGLETQYNITIGTNFTDFIARLTKNIEWFR
jgi:hypothetical protein